MNSWHCFIISSQFLDSQNLGLNHSSLHFVLMTRLYNLHHICTFALKLRGDPHLKNTPFNTFWLQWSFTTEGVKSCSVVLFSQYFIYFCQEFLSLFKSSNSFAALMQFAAYIKPTKSYLLFGFKVRALHEPNSNLISEATKTRLTYSATYIAKS